MQPYTTTPVQFCDHMHGCVLVLGLDILFIFFSKGLDNLFIFSFEQN